MNETITHTKVCTHCQAALPLASFQKCSRNKDRLDYYCRECSSSIRKRTKEYNRTNNQKYAEKRKKRSLYKKYSISQLEYDKLLTEQDRKCAICKQPESTDKSLAVDHNHETGQIRGLLCQKCNTGLGLFKDDINLLRKAKAYLEVIQ